MLNTHQRCFCTVQWFVCWLQFFMESTRCQVLRYSLHSYLLHHLCSKWEVGYRPVVGKDVNVQTMLFQNRSDQSFLQRHRHYATFKWCIDEPRECWNMCWWCFLYNFSWYGVQRACCRFARFDYFSNFCFTRFFEVVKCACCRLFKIRVVAQVKVGNRYTVHSNTNTVDFVSKKRCEFFTKWLPIT